MTDAAAPARTMRPPPQTMPVGRAAAMRHSTIIHNDDTHFLDTVAAARTHIASRRVAATASARLAFVRAASRTAGSVSALLLLVSRSSNPRSNRYM
jgi:hypothetical protein